MELTVLQASLYILLSKHSHTVPNVLIKL